MKTYFVDTGYWLARSDSSDQLHVRAVAVSKKFGTDTHLVITELVLVEWLNATARFGVAARQELVRQIIRMENADDIMVVPQNEYIFRSSLHEYSHYADKDWSFTDITSFHVMRSRNIRDALIYDRHFEQAGFRALLRD